MAAKVHPEQGFRRCRGILRLSQHYPADRMERACARALHFRTLTYKSVKTILQNKLDQQPLPTETSQGSLPLHESIRGSLLPGLNVRPRRRGLRRSEGGASRSASLLSRPRGEACS